MRSRQLLAEQQGQVTPQWMKRIARDHYEDTFLQGPYFDAADPDFHSLCMHSSAANFTWGNTASSCIAVLPRARPNCPCSGGRPAHPATAATSRSSSTAASCRRWSLQPAPLVSASSPLMPPSKIPSHQTPIGGCSVNCWIASRATQSQAFPAYVPCPQPGCACSGSTRSNENSKPRRLPSYRRHWQWTSGGSRAAILDNFTQRCVHKVHAALQELLSTFSSS